MFTSTDEFIQEHLPVKALVDHFYQTIHKKTIVEALFHRALRDTSSSIT